MVAKILLRNLMAYPTTSNFMSAQSETSVELLNFEKTTVSAKIQAINVTISMSDVSKKHARLLFALFFINS